MLSGATFHGVKRVLAACAVALLVAVSGCGSSTGAGVSDPAALAPPGTLAYASFTLAPQGAEQAGFNAAFGKLLGDNPQAKLGAAFTKAAQTSGKLDYLADVKPWLGDTISVAVTRVAPRSCDFVLLAASTDDQKAQAAIDKDLAGVHTESRTYRDVSYKVQDDGTANGIVSHFLVAGTEPAFKAVVDTAKDGKSLADSDQWKNTVGDRANGKVGLAYVDAKGLLQSLASNLPGAQRVIAPLMVGAVQLNPFLATLDAQPDKLVVDVSSPGTKPDPRGPGAASSPLIESMPARAWLALAVPDVGQALSKVTTALKANPLIASQYGQVAQRVRAATGVSLDKDILTLGDVGLFALGSTPSTVSATVVAESNAGSLRRLQALAGKARHGRVQVRRPSQAAQPLGSTALFQKAASAIGGRPTLFVDFAPALRLAAASPKHRGDAHFRSALPRLKHIEYITAGARREGDLDVARGVIGLR
jgi:hypothetical protein